MRFQFTIICAAVGTAIAVSPASHAAYTITQQAAPAPTYNNLLTFDEPGSPTGVVPSNNWLSSHGVTITDGVNGPNAAVADFSGSMPWLNTGNMLEGTFGNFLTFESPTSAMSFQAWDPSGVPDFFGAGLTIVLTDAADNILAFEQFTGAWGGIGDTWFDITTTGGDTFEKVTIFNNSFSPQTYVDNISYVKSVPAPGALALLGFAGVAARRRRRA